MQFTKMQGLGNDFMVIDNTQGQYTITADFIRQLSDRHFGIGFDQCLILEKPNQADVAFDYLIYNADGEQVAQCGNGARCIAKYIFDNQLADENPVKVATQNRILSLHLEDDGNMTVSLGHPLFNPTQVPLNKTKHALSYHHHVNQEEIEFAAVSVGNPHAVIDVEHLNKAPVNKVGKAFNKDKLFPEGVNVGFRQIHQEHEMSLRVFERGVGETLACGSGACAAVVTGILQKKLHSPVTVHLPGGDCKVTWLGHESEVYLTGPAETVFRGEITLVNS